MEILGLVLIIVLTLIIRFIRKGVPILFGGAFIYMLGKKLLRDVRKEELEDYNGNTHEYEMETLTRRNIHGLKRDFDIFED